MKITVTSIGNREEAINEATAIATRTLANVERVEAKRVETLLENSNATGYRTTVEVAYLGEPDVPPTKIPRTALLKSMAPW